MDLFPGQTWPVVQVSRRTACTRARPPPSPTHPISRNRQSRSGPPPVNIAQNYPNPHPCVPVSRPDMAGSPGFQGKGGIHRNISEKGHRCSWPPLPASAHLRLSGTFCWQLAAACSLGGVEIHVGEATCHITESLMYTRNQFDTVCAALELAKYGARDWNLLLTSTFRFR